MDIKSGNVSSSTLQLRITPGMEALQSEILKHPLLMQEMRLESAKGSFKTYEDGLAIIAAYADVTLHGVYGADEMEDLSRILVSKLVAKRSPIV